MPTFKNITVPIGKTGKTRKQRVQVLKSGQFKFVKNLPKGKKITSKKKGGKTRNVRKTAKGKFFGNLSGAGALEDVAWGFVGFSVLGRTPAALPMVRALQGIQGHALGRRGKARMVPAILDLISIWLAGGFGAGLGTAFGGGGAGLRLSDLTQVLKLRPL